MKFKLGNANYKLDTNDKYRLILFRRVSGALNVIKQRKIKIQANEVSYRGKLWPLDIAQPIYRRKNTFYYMVDVMKGQITVTERELHAKEVPPDMLEAILYKSVVAQTVSGLEHPKLGPVIVYVILTAGMCLAVGYIIGTYFPGG